MYLLQIKVEIYDLGHVWLFIDHTYSQPPQKKIINRIQIKKYLIKY